MWCPWCVERIKLCVVAPGRHRVPRGVLATATRDAAHTGEIGLTEKHSNPMGQPAMGGAAIKVVVPRAVAERLTLRESRATRKLETVIVEILERAAK
jgi:hypothetical protein